MIKIFFILNRKVTLQKNRCVGCWLLALPRAQTTRLSRILGIWFTYYVPVLINSMTQANTFLSRTRASISAACWDFFSWAKLLIEVYPAKFCLSDTRRIVCFYPADFLRPRSISIITSRRPYILLFIFVYRSTNRKHYYHWQKQNTECTGNQTGIKKCKSFN